MRMESTSPWGGWAVPAANHVRPIVRVYTHPTALRNLGILKEGDPMSKFLQSEHGDSSSQSTIVAVTLGEKSVGFNAQGWEAFVSPCLGQTQHGRFALHEPQARTEFSDPRDETPNVGMQDGEFFVTDGVRFSAAQSSLSSLPGAGAALASSTASASEKDHSSKTGKEVGGGGSWNRRMWFRRELL